MRLVDVIVAILVPAIFWVAYFRYKDRYQPEPLLVIGGSCVLGMVSAYLCLIAYELGENWGILPAHPLLMADAQPLRFLSYSVVVIGGLEELAKFLPFILVCVRFRAFDEVIDGIVYASMVALGFAAYENILYLEHTQGVELYARAIASPLVHTLFASVWGHQYARARHLGRSTFIPTLLGLLIAMVTHGLYDFLVLATHPLLRPLGALLALIIWSWRLWTFEKKSGATTS